MDPDAVWLEPSGNGKPGASADRQADLWKNLAISGKLNSRQWTPIKIDRVWNFKQRVYTILENWLLADSPRIEFANSCVVAGFKHVFPTWDGDPCLRLPGDWAGQGALVFGGLKRNGSGIWASNLCPFKKGKMMIKHWIFWTIPSRSAWMSSDSLPISWRCVVRKNRCLSIYTFLRHSFFGVVFMFSPFGVLQNYVTILLPSPWEPSCGMVSSCKLSRVPLLFGGKSEPWLRILGATYPFSIKKTPNKNSRKMYWIHS